MLAVVLAVSAIIYAGEDASRTQRQHAGETMALRLLDRSVNQVLLHEQELGNVIAALHSPIGDRWPVLSQVLMGEPTTHGTGFIVPLTESGRQAYERATGHPVVSGFHPGLTAPAVHRGPHWVLEYSTQRSGKATPMLGLDLVSNPLRAPVLARAAATGQLEATAPLRFLSQTPESGVIVYRAVFQRGRLLGWLTTSYTPSTLAATVQTESAGLHLRIADGRTTLVAGHGQGDGMTSTFAVANRRWTVTAWSPAPPRSLLPWFVLVIGTLLTLGLVLVLRAVGAREQYALAEVSRHVAVERERLDELEDRRRELAEAQTLAGIGSWSWDPHTDAYEWSDEMYRIYARDPELGPLVPEELIAHLHPEDRARMASDFARALGGTERFEFEHRIVRPDGDVRYLRSVGQRDERDRFVGTVQDLTALRVARTEAETQRELAAQVIATANEAFVSTDLTGRIQEWNPGAERLYGYTAKEAIGRPITLILPAERADEGDQMLHNALNGEATSNVDTARLRSDGTKVDVSLSVAPIRDGNGRTVGASFIARDIGERKRFEGQLQYLADHDALTGLFNRRRFEAELERAVAHTGRYGSRGAVLMIDLDGFKHVNDTMGHSHGDELVTRVARLMTDTLRETDVVARIGGDEFAVIAAEAGPEDALTIAEKLLDALRSRAVVLSDSGHTTVTASIGVTTFDATTRSTAEELLVEADIAMYGAKESGRNRASLYDRDADRAPTLVARDSWLERLQTAIREERFELLAQPIEGICADGLPRYELLLRLRSDDGDLIPPGTFLYNAERFELIQQIDRWVFEQAVHILREHEQAGYAVSLSVNMSAKTLCDPTILDDLSAIVKRCPIPRNQLVVEVTETAAIVNIDKARTVARGLRELGCQFALDDFGAGFASFYYLKHLDFDYLKIDGEFIKSLTQNTTDQLVVQSVVDIARGLGVKTIAEFVGDDLTIHRLRQLGVDYGQGYHLGRPAPVSSILAARPQPEPAADHPA